jgi:hypothetical protein
MINVAQLQSKGLTFPGRAGALQRSGAIAALIKELGTSYGTYHEFLASEVAKLGRPDPSAHPDYQSYAQAYAHGQVLVFAEAFIRNCHAYMQSGRALDAGLDTSVPLLDADDRLVGLDDTR